MTFTEVAQDIVFHLHSETDNKFLHAGEKKRQKGRGAHYLCMSHVKASEKVLFKNKPSETPEGAPGSAL